MPACIKRVGDGPDVFAELGSFAIWVPAGEPRPVGYKTKSSDIFKLRLSDDNSDKAEFQWRMSTPLSALLLALLAIPLSRSRPRQGQYARMLGALIIYAVYFNLLDVSKTWVEQGTSESIWWAPGLLALLVLILYAALEKICPSRLACAGACKMMILDRYIASSYLKGMVPVMLLLLSLFSFLALAEELEEVGQGTFRLIDAFLVVLYTSPRRIVDLMPVTALLGGLMGLGATGQPPGTDRRQGRRYVQGANGKTGFSGHHDRGGAGGVDAVAC